VPRRTILAEKILKDREVYDKLIIKEYPMEFILVEHDVISMEYPLSFKLSTADKNSQCNLVYEIGRSLIKLASI
jgi:hypothetical protein